MGSGEEIFKGFGFEVMMTGLIMSNAMIFDRSGRYGGGEYDEDLCSLFGLCISLAVQVFASVWASGLTYCYMPPTLLSFGIDSASCLHFHCCLVSSRQLCNQ